MSCLQRASANVGATLGNGFHQTLLAEEGDGTAGSGAGHFKGFDDLRLGGDA